MSRRAARRDENEPEIVEAAKAYARRHDRPISIEYLDGTDIPDLLIGYRSRNILVEVKNPDGKDRGALRPGQKRWHGKWAGTAQVVRYTWEMDEVLMAVDRMADDLLGGL